ncbi:acyltransferase family protein [Methylorubrum rhodesianum]|uniref:acyltransferase family protein n=2 Tax=Methylorubrum TaxID=2282523 RepID=UPI001AEF28BB|nr:acyltransferase [Methylorubrum rhodesianum]MBI1691997.1 acyltransferase [Methylorubrum sp. DB1722]
MRIVSIQYLRGLAVLAVLLAHSVQYPMKSPDFDWIRVGRLGVILFFVISGFVMVFVTGSGRFDSRDFLRRRVVRIVPLYWIATFATAALAISAPSIFKTSVFSLDHFILSLLFVPHVSPSGDTAPLLKLGWTLNYEMFFYLVFAMLFFTTALRRVTAISLTFAAFVILGLLFEPRAVLLDTYSNYMLLAFCAGAWLGLLRLNDVWDRMPDRAAPLLLALAVLGCLGGFLLERGTRGAELAGASMIIGSTALVAVGLRAERRLPHWKALEGLGNASYSIYLGHIYCIAAVNVLAKRLFTDAQPLSLLVPAGLFAGLAGGLLFFIAVEKPVLRLFGVRLARSGPAVPKAGPTVRLRGSGATG